MIFLATLLDGVIPISFFVIVGIILLLIPLVAVIVILKIFQPKIRSSEKVVIGVISYLIILCFEILLVWFAFFV